MLPKQNSLLYLPQMAMYGCWTRLPEAVQWVTSLDGAISTPPLLTNQTLYVGTMRRMLHALDVDTGVEVWNHEVKDG